MIYLIPMGDINLDYIQKAKFYVEEVYEEKANILGSISFPENCLNCKRNQYDAICVLEHVPYCEDKVIGICDKDIYVEGLNFVFGVAESINGKRGIISIKRLRESFYGKKENEEILILRIAKEIIHELGHLKGLNHCKNKRCVMAFSNSIHDTDFKDYKICDECKRRLK